MPPTPTTSTRRWTSWSGAVVVDQATIARPSSVGELASLVARQARVGGRLRPVGAGMSCSPVAAGRDLMVSLEGLPDAAPEVDPDDESVVLGAGTTLADVSARLAPLGLALPVSLGDARITVAGALQTGSHGRSGRHGPLHAMALGIELVDADGVVRWATDDELPAARVGLGAIGVITRARLRTVPVRKLAQLVTTVELSDALMDFPRHTADHDEAALAWLPGTGRARLTLGDATDEAPEAVGPVARALDRVLDEALPWLGAQAAMVRPAVGPAIADWLGGLTVERGGIRDVTDVPAPARLRRHELEYLVPADTLTPAVEAIDALVRREAFGPVLPATAVPVARDETAWLSPAWGRDCAAVAVASPRGRRYTGYFTAVEQVLRGFGGRPHWGKMHTLRAEQLSNLYPRWDDWVAARRALDPRGLFVSDHLERVLGPIDG